MLRRINRKNVVKAISLGLSVYMALIPIVVRTDELSDAERSLAEQIEVREETAANVEQAVEDEINLIENEAIKEATEAIMNVDMSDVDEGLEKVTELISDTLTDETVASQIEVTADALISIYDAQAENALAALKAISEEMDAVTVLDDCSVNIDWNAATDEVVGLYETYQAALTAKEEAQNAKDVAIEEKNAMSDKINEINDGAINNNKKASEAISNSKQDKSSAINEIIADVAQLHSKDIKSAYSLDQKISGSSDIYRFYINLVEDGIAYGCLTYYDSENKTILRKNFKISPDSIDYDYVPKDEWVKENAKCEKVVFGNSGNYIGAYIENTSGYISGGKTFDGPKVSTLIRNNVNLNNDIDARNQALIDLEEINQAIEKAEEDLKNASDNAENALEAYKRAVEMYKEAAELDEKIKNSKVEKAKLEYVKAQVEVFRKKQELEQIKNIVNNAVSDSEAEVVSVEAYDNIETIIDGIAENLDVEPEAVESMVAQIIIDEDNSFINDINNDEDTTVLGVRRNEEKIGVEEVSNTLDAAKEIVIIEDEEVPLACFNEDFGYSINWWLPLIIAMACVTVIMYIVVNKNKKKN